MKKLLVITVIGLILGLIGGKFFQESLFSMVHFVDGAGFIEHDMQNMQDTGFSVCKTNGCVIFSSSDVIRTALLTSSEFRELVRIFSILAVFTFFAFALHREFWRSRRQKVHSFSFPVQRVLSSVILRE